MSIEAISGVLSTPNTQDISTLSRAAEGFDDMLVNKLQEVNDAVVESEKVLQALALNEPMAAHEVILTMQKAKSQLKFTVEIRNKLLESYQELMRMQV